MFYKKKLNQFVILGFSAFLSFEVVASVQNVDVETIAFPSLIAEDKVERIPQPEGVTPLKIQRKKESTSLPSQLVAPVSVGCTQAELTTAIIDGNNSGTPAVLKLPSNCTYTIQFKDGPFEAFPAITGDITIIGGENTLIKRDPTALDFRIFSVNANATLNLQHLTIENGKSNSGGAIFVGIDGNLVLDQVTLSHNTAFNGGAVTVSSGATAQVFTSTFLFNTGNSTGGGAFINFGQLYIKNSYLSDNTAGSDGGAINTQFPGTTTIVLSLLTHNSAGSLGGALSNLGILHVTQSIINYNNGGTFGGGGISTAPPTTKVVISQTSNTAILFNQPNNCIPLNMIKGCVN